MVRINKVLIANRGEIAKRIANVLLEKNIVPVVPVVEKEFNQVFNLFAGCELVKCEQGIFLNQQKLLKMAKERNCQAIHPGYGFLSENSQFAELCEDEGVEFIGPPPMAIELMGDKETARTLATQAGVPPVPGFTIENMEIDEIKKKANEIGFPVLIKASKGGGGKGMRKIDNPNNLEDGLRLAKSESLQYFGSKTVFIEKYIENPRHIEIQIFSFPGGRTVYLGERECSIQRRHQKIIEETPSPFITERIRKKMGECAVKLADKVGYIGAGTVEFIMDKDKNYYFLEMNTRIQVEHPITEEIFGVDLVKWQVEEAMGLVEYVKQEKIKSNGYAIELRIYAEDPNNNFIPSPGKILLYKEPKGPGIRVESAIQTGSEIFSDFDPMIAKLVVKAENREKGIEKAIKALKDFCILGITTNREYLINILQTEEFKKGLTDTSFTDKYANKLTNKKKVLSEKALTGAYFLVQNQKTNTILTSETQDYYPQITTRIP
jgi:acetyl/propionyl-CoA carboxylase alpha subunit